MFLPSLRRCSPQKTHDDYLWFHAITATASTTNLSTISWEFEGHLPQCHVSPQKIAGLLKGSPSYNLLSWLGVALGGGNIALRFPIFPGIFGFLVDFPSQGAVTLSSLEHFLEAQSMKARYQAGNGEVFEVFLGQWFGRHLHQQVLAKKWRYWYLTRLFRVG